MAEAESAHGKLSKVDQDFDSTRFMILFWGTIAVVLVTLYCMSSIKTGDWSYYPFAHDLLRHTLETSQM